MSENKNMPGLRPMFKSDNRFGVSDALLDAVKSVMEAGEPSELQKRIQDARNKAAQDPATPGLVPYTPGTTVKANPTATASTGYTNNTAASAGEEWPGKSIGRPKPAEVPATKNPALGQQSSQQVSQDPGPSQSNRAAEMNVAGGDARMQPKAAAPKPAAPQGDWNGSWRGVPKPGEVPATKNPNLGQQRSQQDQERSDEKKIGSTDVGLAKPAAPNAAKPAAPGAAAPKPGAAPTPPAAGGDRKPNWMERTFGGGKTEAPVDYNDQSPLGALRQYDAAKKAGTLPPVSAAPSQAKPAAPAAAPKPAAPIATTTAPAAKPVPTPPPRPASTPSAPAPTPTPKVNIPTTNTMADAGEAKPKPEEVKKPVAAREEYDLFSENELERVKQIASRIK